MAKKVAGKEPAAAPRQKPSALVDKVTPLNYDCSVYGSAVTLARRCCQVEAHGFSSSIVMPANLWGGRKLEEVFQKEEPHEELSWEVLPPRKETLKGKQELNIVEVAMQTSFCSFSPSMKPEKPEDRAKKAFEGLKRDGSYKPRRDSFEPIPELLKRDDAHS